jgi:hypothetical protein
MLGEKRWDQPGVPTISAKQRSGKGHTRKRSACHSSATVHRTRKLIGKSAAYAVGHPFLRVYLYINLPDYPCKLEITKAIVQSFSVMWFGGRSAKRREKNLTFVLDTPGVEDPFACVALER